MFNVHFQDKITMRMGHQLSNTMRPYSLRMLCRWMLHFCLLCPCLAFSFVPHRRPSLLPTRKHGSSSTSTVPKSYSSTLLSMSLIPLPVEELERLIATGAPSASQYSTYWGRTPRERYGRLLESAIVGFLGVFFSYFMSFVLGSFVATIFGTLFLFWGILSPQLKAYQRNWEFLGGRELVDPWTVQGDPEHAGLYGALFLGSIADVCVVENDDATTEYDLAEFDDYSMEADELERWTGRPYLLRVLATDQTGRELQVHGRLSEEYLTVSRGMPLVGILLSTTPRFDRLSAITDLYVPDAACWIGDYPYLDRAEIELLLSEDDEVWDSLEEERVDDSIQDEAEQDDIALENEDKDIPPEDDTDDLDATSDELSKDKVYARRRRR